MTWGNSGFYHDDSAWSIEDYKNGLRLTRIPKKDMSMVDNMVNRRINDLPITNLKKFYSSVQNKEFHLLPSRVWGNAENANALSNHDIRMHSFTCYSKHAYMTMFIFEMTDTLVQAQPFVQVALERFYSRKKGYGSSLLKHLVKYANKHDVILTVWWQSFGFQCRSRPYRRNEGVL